MNLPKSPHVERAQTVHMLDANCNDDVRQRTAPVPRADRIAFHLGYRPWLDGLRAIAILMVMCYHAGTPLARGGYLGVDILVQRGIFRSIRWRVIHGPDLLG